MEDGRGLPVPNASVRLKESFESWQTWEPKGFKRFDVELISSAKDVSSIPTSGSCVIRVANVQGVLHFRIVDFPGNLVVDTGENQLPDKAPQIAQLKSLLSTLWVLRGFLRETKTGSIRPSHQSSINPRSRKPWKQREPFGMNGGKAIPGIRVRPTIEGRPL